MSQAIYNYLHLGNLDNIGFSEYFCKKRNIFLSFYKNTRNFFSLGTFLFVPLLKYHQLRIGVRNKWTLVTSN